MSTRLWVTTCLAALSVVMSSGCGGTATPGPTRSLTPALPTSAAATATPPPQVTSTPLPATTPPAAATPLLSASACISLDGLPDSNCTPGAIDPRVTQQNTYQTICVSGYTETVRPSTSYTTPLKVRQMALYGWTGTKADYEEDHLIALELGGHPTDPNNLWPEPYDIPQGARVKDRVENLLHDRVCSGQMALAEAQSLMATNWEAVSAGGTTGEIIPAPPPSAAVDTPSQGCCKHCTTGKACGDSCISKNYTCHQPPGCACNAY